MLSRKHFRAVAEILRDTRTRDGTPARTLQPLADRLADWFRADNPAFDRERFRAATGLWEA